MAKAKNFILSLYKEESQRICDVWIDDKVNGIEMILKIMQLTKAIPTETL